MSAITSTPLAGTAHSEQQVRQQAVVQFQNAFAGTVWHRILNWLAGRQQCLLNLGVTQRKRGAGSEYDGGVRVVPVAQIVGSQNRACDFRPDFRPRQAHTRSRWIGIAMAVLIGSSLPPVELIQVGDSYFVSDGHHRISVARANGQDHIDAHITVLEVQK